MAIQRERLVWNYITTFRHAQLVAPDIFGGMNVSVPKLWKYSDEKSAFGSGSAKRVPDAVYTVLREILKAATSKLLVSSSVLQLLANKELEKLGFESVSRRWVQRFMHQGEMSFRKHVIRQSLKFSVEEVADLQGNVREKLIYLLDLWKVPPSRCYNYDETSVCLLPLGTRGWKDKQEQAMAATDGKLQCTVGLAILPHCLESYNSAQFAFSVARQHALCLQGDPLADHRVCAGVCDIPGQQVVRVELSTRSLGLSDRCCSSPHCVCFSPRLWHSQRTLE